MTAEDDIFARLFDQMAEPEPAPPPEPARIISRAAGDAARAEIQDRDRTARLRKALAAQVASDPDRLEWPDWWFDPVTSIIHRQIRRLWMSVLAQVATDAAMTSSFSHRQRADALAWLNGHRRDRAFVCGLADFDPDEFSRAVLAWVEKGAPRNACL